VNDYQDYGKLFPQSHESGSIAPTKLKTIFEQQEAAYWKEYFMMAPRQSLETLGLGCRKIKKAVAVFASHLDILAFNRVIGLGVELPASSKQINEIISIYRTAKVNRFFVQLSPYARPEHTKQDLEGKGFSFYNNWVKLFRTLTVFPASRSSLDIRRIYHDQATDFAKIITQSFNWPQSLIPMLSMPVGKPGWKHYLAYEENQPVACAALYIRGSHASLAFAATLEQFQGREIQTALIVRRLQDAKEAGCQWVFTETAEETPEHPVPSFRNMMRYGFAIAYRRPNYIYEFKKV
jgi:hypothetical protein